MLLKYPRGQWVKCIPQNFIGNKWSCRVWHLLFYNTPKVEWEYTGFTLMSVCPSVHPFIYSFHNTFVFFSKTSVRAWFVSWGAAGWRFVINSRANIHVTIDSSTVLPLVLGVVTRQKPQINGSVALGADESPWPCSTPSWYISLSWMILSKQKNLHLFLSQYICGFL